LFVANGCLHFNLASVVRRLVNETADTRLIDAFDLLTK